MRLSIFLTLIFSSIFLVNAAPHARGLVSRDSYVTNSPRGFLDKLKGSKGLTPKDRLVQMLMVVEGVESDFGDLARTTSTWSSDAKSNVKDKIAALHSSLNRCERKKDFKNVPGTAVMVDEVTKALSGLSSPAVQGRSGRGMATLRTVQTDLSKLKKSIVEFKP
ncbi:hypothetical protein C8J56DRAFT_937328 [Mycena floridula]|nr:hypothetical protein C8J56DRAFT_937328 [Mycena floridula]